MATPFLDERIDLDGVPLSTPAWEINDLSPLWDLPEVIAHDLKVPYRRGVIPFRRPLAGKSVDLPFTIIGAVDPDGVAHPDPREGLQLNHEAFMAAIAPPMVATITGTRVLTYHLPDGTTRTGPAALAGRLRPQPFGPGALRGSLALNLTDGGLRSTTEVDVTSASIAGGASGNLVVPNPGTDYQDRALLDLTGTATTVTLRNLTAEPGGSVFLTFGGALSTGVALDTGLWTATRAGVNVVGLIIKGGFERWLPLVRGNNTIEIAPSGGTAVLRVRHFPFYL